MDASYALMVRAFAGVPGKTILEAIDLTNETFGLEREKQEDTEAQNDQSLKQLRAMMSSV